MRVRGRIRPSKSASAAAMITGIAFVGVGLFLVIPHMGIIGVFWTVVSLAITGYHAFNLFSEHGIADEVVEFDTSASSDSANPLPNSIEQRLAELDGLRTKGLIDRNEYEEQRKRILDDI